MTTIDRIEAALASMKQPGWFPEDYAVLRQEMETLMPLLRAWVDADRAASEASDRYDFNDEHDREAHANLTATWSADRRAQERLLAALTKESP
jgi:hypothetical protein